VPVKITHTSTNSLSAALIFTPSKQELAPA
jgi:hypothetical protein